MPENTVTPTESREPLLRIVGLSKSFPGVRALAGASIDVAPGEIHALVGENGAGKSTLVKIVAGLQAPDSGEIHVEGRRVARFSPGAAMRAGIALVAQEPEHFADLTALENLFVGRWTQRPPGVVSWAEMARRARELFAEMEVRVALTERMGDLPLADRQMIQIGRALLQDARVLILDEPTAALGQAETDVLFRLVKRLAERGVAVVYISHRLEEIFELTDTVTVLRDGELVDTLPTAQLDRDALVRMMVGSEVDRTAGTIAASEADRTGTPVLELTDVGAGDRFEGVNLTLHSGEILGIAGLAGCGRNALAHALGGVQRLTAGEVKVNGARVKLTGPRSARKAGIVLAPGDRPGKALVLPLSVRENVTLSVLGEVGKGLFTSRTRETEVAHEYTERLDVRAASIEQITGTLSGGNQQKTSLARRLAARPKVLVLEEPTQGVDVGARAEIHRLLRELADEGLAIILVSSEMEELIGLSDRIAVMHRGRVAGELAGAEATKEEILRLAFGEGVEETERAAERTKPRLAIGRELALAGFLIAACVALAIANDTFVSVINIRDMAVNSSDLLIAALGMTIVILTAGIDISVGSMLALCCMAAGTLASRGSPIGWVILGTLLSGAVLGAVNGCGIAFMKLPPIIMTLATLTVYRGLVLRLGGGSWITDLPDSFSWLGKGVVAGAPVPVLTAAIATGAVALALARTRFGRSVYAIGNNPAAAGHLGVSERTTSFWVYTVAGLLIAVASLAYAPRFSSVQTNTGIGFEMKVITAVVVGGTNIFGGRGTVLGTLLGVALLTVIDNGLNLLGVNDNWEKAFQGLLVLAAVTTDFLRTRAQRRGGEE